MQTLVMRSAKRNGEFIADLASECSQLGELQMMGISGTFLANETRLASHKRKVHLAPLPWRFLGEGEAEVSLIGEGESSAPPGFVFRRRLPIDLSYIDRRHLILLG